MAENGNSPAFSETVDAEQNTRLHKALMTGEFEEATKLLASGVSVTRVNKKLQTPLHLAVLHASDAIIEKILSCGADVNARDKDGKSPIYLATEWGKEETVKLLVKNATSPRADVNICDKDGNCPLHAAVAINHQPLTNFLLSEANASISMKNNMGRTPIHVLGEKGGDGRVLEALLKTAADINGKDNDGNTPLHLAVGFCHQQVATELCKHGASVCEINSNDATCLDKLPFGDPQVRLDIQKKMLAALPAPAEWVPDSASPHCQVCKATFTTKNRRHHCRNCGRLVCSKCSPTKKNIAKWNLKNARLCYLCESVIP
jgi:ankyrin repeat protein